MNSPWERAFRQLSRKHGFNVRAALHGVSFEEIAKKEAICMPAIYPLDSSSSKGALWVVGTPLFDNYYTRWSFPIGGSQPEVYFQDVREAPQCRDTLGASRSAARSDDADGQSLMRSEARRPPPLSRPASPAVRDIE